MQENRKATFRPMFRLFNYLKNYKGLLIFASASSIIHKMFDLMPPIMVGWSVDVLNKESPNWLIAMSGNDLFMQAVLISLFFVLIFGLESLTEWMLKNGFLKLAQRVQHDLRMDAYRKMQEREISYFESNRTGNLIAMLNDDINQLERFLNDNVNQILQLITLFAFSGLALFGVDFWMAIIGIIPIPLIVWGSFIYQRIISPKYKRIREAVGELSSRLENNISGIAVIKSFTAEKFEEKRVADASLEYKQANYAAIKYNSLYTPTIRMLIALGLAGGILLGSWYILEDMDKISVGDIALYALMLQRLLWPVTRMGAIFDEFERAKASARRIFTLMDTPSEVTEKANAIDFGKAAGEITFNNVSFYYTEGIPVLKTLNEKLEAGKTIGIAGQTGGGKTTLIKLLLRLYDVKEGAILLDNHNIKDLSFHCLRSNIALVSQDVYLFHGTILENISYGMNFSEEAIISACRKAQLHDFIISLPKGYDTIVGERGIKLSGGQRQRISIARAILKDAPILILDEATSSVDTETERAIQENIYQLVAGKTALIIAHRLSTIRHADKILVLKEGEIIESGTHDTLLEQKGLYAELWNVQTGIVFKEENT
ncbi:ABC transporter ATP-binding protein [Chondrinema litorale]|uniref:ABC transporter ATP-binding protein n=1 Tax=Chondrinema litorale TaxID=2994555 RepID=UPI0025436838|nr:ABC transporter ATP-binding protein [Chondrinema litorale]UZR94966.1 ABC transporter ATP-binding protein [Chondrinema litorale]